MPVIFEGNAGRVFSVGDSAALGLIQLASVSGGVDNGDKLTYERYNTIITAIGTTTTSNQQFLHTVGGSVYVYVFGDRMGTLELQGISFSSRCENVVVSDSEPEQHGFEKLLAWYKENRLAKRRAPVQVLLGLSTTISGFLTELIQRSEDSQSRTVQFTMRLSTLPEL